MTESTENLVAGFFIGSVACLPTEDYRTLKSDDGVELEAQVVSCVVDEALTLRKSDGRVPWSRFSPEDQSYLRTSS